MKRVIFSFLLYPVFVFAVIISCNAQELNLASNGTANYSIITTGDDMENAAAKILQENLNKISGAGFHIAQSVKSNALFVLTASNAQKKLSLSQSEIPGDEGVGIITSAKDIYIFGGTGNGLKNAVYEFLQKYLGCRYYTADAVLLPANKNISIPSAVKYIYTPAIKYRYIFYGPAFKGEYAAWNKLQNIPGAVKGPSIFGLFVHSMFTLVPPEKYFATHPEYYALRNGKRVKTQLDLTNIDVLRIARQSLDSIIKKNPQASMFSVSQMDNEGYCQCSNCKRKAAETGSQSGVILNFVNQLAATFPDKIISTLAYHYSRPGPSTIVPAKNVNIMFCATGANRSMPFEAYKTKGSVYYDLNAWRKLTNNIFFWDYLVDFKHLYLPFPVYHTLQPNIQLIASGNIPYTFMQGWAYNGSDMPELKSYMLAQLLWNPDVEINQTQSEFIKFYYGDAAPHILKYITDMTAYVQSHKINLSNNDAPLDHINDFLSPAQIALYQQAFNEAKNAVANNNLYLRRVQNAAQSLRYAILEGVSKQDATAEDSVGYLNIVKEFNSIAEKDNVNSMAESGNNLKDFVAGQQVYQQSKVVNNLAAGAFVSIVNPPAYPVNNLNDLLDNLKASKTIDSKWVAFQQPYIELMIDLKTITNIDSVSATFMHNPAAKVQLPEAVKYAVSTNGKNFTEIGIARNVWARLGVKEELKTFTVKAPGNTNARFVKLQFKMVNSPNITGDDLPQSMLCDEILVQ